jgi:hypothetical protein
VSRDPASALRLRAHRPITYERSLDRSMAEPCPDVLRLGCLGDQASVSSIVVPLGWRATARSLTRYGRGCSHFAPIRPRIRAKHHAPGRIENIELCGPKRLSRQIRGLPVMAVSYSCTAPGFLDTEQAAIVSVSGPRFRFSAPRDRHSGNTQIAAPSSSRRCEPPRPSVFGASSSVIVTPPSQGLRPAPAPEAVGRGVR